MVAAPHPDSAAELADLVTIMNCYYLNLIEGHNTRPCDIERALQGAELEAETRPLALEARAHVVVQRQIDGMFRAGSPGSPTDHGFIAWVHGTFYKEMPPEFRFVIHPDGRTEPIIPGRFRTEGDPEVAVDRHLPPASGHVASFMDHFTRRFRSAEASASGRIVAIAAAHHRLNYIHPFPDGTRWWTPVAARPQLCSTQGLVRVCRALRDSTLTHPFSFAAQSVGPARYGLLLPRWHRHQYRNAGKDP